MKRVKKKTPVKVPACDICLSKPAYVGIVLQDGKPLNICFDCVCAVGEMSEDERADFFKKYGISK